MDSPLLINKLIKTRDLEEAGKSHSGLNKCLRDKQFELYDDI